MLVSFVCSRSNGAITIWFVVGSKARSRRQTWQRYASPTLGRPLTGSCLTGVRQAGQRHGIGTSLVTDHARGEELWRLAKVRESDLAVVSIASCELRDDSNVGAGWEVLVRHDDEIIVGRRCESEAMARYYANVFRQDYARSGWAGTSH
jgi:hypothetical protein